MSRILEILKVSTRLGLTSFGGPIAHLGYFHEEYVRRRKWLDEKSYADLVALCQFLPGPASSQVGMAIGIQRAGLLGGLMAWIGFTLPSAIALVIFAAVLKGFNIQNAGWLHGLMIVAVAVVAQAVWGMARNLASGRLKGTIAVLSAGLTLLIPNSLVQIFIIVAAGIVGWRVFKSEADAEIHPIQTHSKKTGITFLTLFFVLLIALPIIRLGVHSPAFAMFDSFYRAGSLVFGGGHVVLPLLQRDVVPTGWMSNAQFLAGYGAAQAVPGPLFTFSAYLGFVAHPSGMSSAAGMSTTGLAGPGTGASLGAGASLGVLGSVIGLVAIFLPAFLLVAGVLPFWNAMRQKPGLRSSLAGVNAAVVGILVAALYNPVWTSAVKTPYDFALALVAFAMLMIWKLPPWIVVVVCAIGGAALSAFGLVT